MKYSFNCKYKQKNRIFKILFSINVDYRMEKLYDTRERRMIWAKLRIKENPFELSRERMVKR